MANLLGSAVAPLRRTPKGILSLPALSAFTDYLVAKEAGRECGRHVERLQPAQLTPAQFAVLHRLGLRNREIADRQFAPAFHPAGFSLHDTLGHDLHRVGSKAISYFTKEYVHAKWPFASPSLHAKLSAIYGGTVGLAGMGRQHGLEQCIANILGVSMEPLPQTIPDLNVCIRHLVFPRERANLKFLGDPEKDAYICWSMTALVGAMLAGPFFDGPVLGGPLFDGPVLADPVLADPVLADPVLADPVLADPVLADPVLADPVLADPLANNPLANKRTSSARYHRVRSLLDTRLFSAVCRVKDVFETEHPLLELSEAVRSEDPSRTLTFRLLAESGRLSTDSMFVVGVFTGAGGGVKLGEGFGQSILVAQKRACVEALRLIYLQERSDLKRPSDSFTDADFERILN